MLTGRFTSVNLIVKSLKTISRVYEPLEQSGCNPNLVTKFSPLKDKNFNCETSLLFFRYHEYEEKFY